MSEKILIVGSNYYNDIYHSKILKKLIGPLISLLFLFNMTSVGYAETTVSAEVSFIFNT